MKKIDIIGVLAVIVTWLIICLTGPVIWETSSDVFGGIVLGLVITVLLVLLTGGPNREQSEYNEYGEYKY